MHNSASHNLHPMPMLRANAGSSITYTKAESKGVEFGVVDKHKACHIFMHVTGVRLFPFCQCCLQFVSVTPGGQLMQV